MDNLQLISKLRIVSVFSAEYSNPRRISILCRDGAKGFEAKKPGKKSPEKANKKPQNPFPQTKINELSIGGPEATEGNEDVLFEQRLEAIRSSGMEKKRVEEEKKYGPVDYSAPPEDKKKDNIAVKVGAGLTVLALIVSFAIGDFLPTASKNVGNEAVSKLNPADEEKFQAEVKKFEEILTASPDDSSALEGAAVAYAELGEFSKSKANLEKLTRIAPQNVEALRLLAEVRSSLDDYEGSSTAYRQAIKASSEDSMELVIGLTQALIDAKKPGEAVDELLKIKAKLKPSTDVQTAEVKQEISGASKSLDPVQLDLLLGRSYYAWNRVGDALTMYDAVIKNHPNDFRGYLAKGVLLKEQGRASDAERMFIQARYFAPEKAKSLVDKFTRQ